MKAVNKFLACCSVLLSGLTFEANAIYADTQASQGHLNWEIDFNSASKQAESSQKPLFLLFTGSEWCPFCVRLEKEILSNHEFEQLVGDKFIFVKIDFPLKNTLPESLSSQNQALKSKYSIQGLPTVIILSPSGKIIDRLGYEAGGAEKYAQKLLDSLNRNQKGK